ncbi:DNA polymerase delta catalytic subunit-like [Malus sylvestris]|uniref:DNA polymerase delta catalytic subunit-like n=1 Tax=Malus sylvestris TaxID=3752 RepID=UPI0021AD3A99|nr:DNA polymerase delta catalytic subunit-like [Malus sylvestris]
MNKGISRKRPAPPQPAANPAEQQATSPEEEEEEFVDEDVFLDETLFETEDNLVLRDIEQRQSLASRLTNWARPPLSHAYTSASRSIAFQQLEIDYVIREIHRELLPNWSGSAAIIRIFRVTKEAQMSLFLLLHYFNWLCLLCLVIQYGRMGEVNRNSKVPKFIRRIEMVQKRSIMYYQQQDSEPFLKIVVALPTMVASCRGILEKGIQIDGLGMKKFMTYDSNVLFALRFMIDCNIVGGNWIEVPAGKYKTTKPLSYCQLEFHCLYLDLISHTPEGEFSKMAPFHILSVDIECAGRKGHFPEPTHDPVIQVANLVTMQGENQPFIRNVMTLKSCAPIVGVDVMPFDTEREVLLAWRYGTRESKEVTVEGRVQFDLLQAMQRDYKLSSYSLNSVSAHFLSEQKEDVHHSIISDLQNGNAETRRRFAVYCLKDAYLPQRLLDKLMYIYNYVEMARVTGVPMSFLLSRGQSIKVLLQLLRKAKQKNLLIPYVKKAGSEQGTYEGATWVRGGEGF